MLRPVQNLQTRGRVCMAAPVHIWRGLRTDRKSGALCVMLRQGQDLHKQAGMQGCACACNNVTLS